MPSSSALPISTIASDVHYAPEALEPASASEPLSTQRREIDERGVFAERYCLEGLIARGGMGDVYRGRHLSLGHPIAIKVLRREYWDQPQLEALFEQEARIGARLAGVYVPRVFDFGRSEHGAPFLVTELLEGMDLRSLLDRNDVFAVDYVLKVFLAICDAVASVHAQGVVHRDVKPGNLFLATEAGRGTRLKLLDFGIAKPLYENDVCAGTDFGAGSPVYMSPEQAISPDTVDERTDIWSLGIVLYELLVGRPPAFRRSHAELRVGTVPFEPPSHFRSVSPELDRIVTGCLAHVRELRFSSVTELREATAALMTSPSSKPGPVSKGLPGAPQEPSRKEETSGVSPFDRLSRWVRQRPFAHNPRMGV